MIYIFRTLFNHPSYFQHSWNLMSAKMLSECNSFSITMFRQSSFDQSSRKYKFSTTPLGNTVRWETERFQDSRGVTTEAVKPRVVRQKPVVLRVAVLSWCSFEFLRAYVFYDICKRFYCVRRRKIPFYWGDNFSVFDFFGFFFLLSFFLSSFSFLLVVFKWCRCVEGVQNDYFETYGKSHPIIDRIKKIFSIRRGKNFAVTL